MRDDIKATWIEEDKLAEKIHQECLNCGEVVPLDKMIGDVLEIEKDNKCQFTGRQIVHFWAVGVNQCIDSHITNLYDTPLDEDYTEEDRDERVADWETQRPENARREQIARSIKLVVGDAYCEEE
tara:strand:+ start:118 stop:492 length:375 start_codon:yes stop_codon:yes gene_type:complete